MLSKKLLNSLLKNYELRPKRYKCLFFLSIPELFLIWILWITFVIFFPTLPLTTNVVSQDIFKSNIHYEEFKEDLKSVSIYDVSLHNKYTIHNYLLHERDMVYGKYYPFLKKIILTSSEYREETLFHEYLHHRFFEQNLSEWDMLKLYGAIYSIPNEREFMNVLYPDSDVITQTTEYISHRYDDYYNTCLKEAGVVSSTWHYISNDIIRLSYLFIKYNLLPKSIICEYDKSKEADYIKGLVLE